MNSEQGLTASEQWQQQAHQWLIRGNYTQAASGYEQAIVEEPDVKSHYWHLGLALLLQGQEVEAQTTWLMGMMEGEPEQVEEWTSQLRQVLENEATRRQSLEEDSVAWTIRQQIRELCPTALDNLLHLIQLDIKLERYTAEELTELGVLELLRTSPTAPDYSLLMEVLRSVLESAPLFPSTLELAEVCLGVIRDANQALKFVNIVLSAAIDIAYSQKQPGLSASLGEMCLRLDPKHTEVLRYLAGFYQNSDQFEKGIETAQLYYSLSEELVDKVAANQTLLRGLMTAGGHWEEACSVMQRHQLLVKSLLESPWTPIDRISVTRLFNLNYFLPYFQDAPQDFRQLQNQVSQVCQANVEIYAKEQVNRYRQGHKERKQRDVATKPLKIGYLSYCFRNHSVGWLARWLMQYHDRDRFQLNGYFLISDSVYSNPLQQWYISQFAQVFQSKKSMEMAEQIYQDEIDILIDLDSLTLDLSCEVVALKPAPVQVTWLGWDASGIPTVDYFIADSYVLPDSAQEYYSEKIWRLPHSYIAVDGFETGVPTLRREQLEIDRDAVVYLSVQKGYKRHPDTARLQMTIIKEVPNSYFLIKGGADEKAIKSLFIQIAEEIGVDCDRLRFVQSDVTETTHRANFGIADVVLDTYPYNGATTTLEALWMGVPLVTRVGEQFAARNSYTMLMNAGVTEGIAWSDEEYLEWGVRLGTDEALRQQVAWKLRQSRQTAPLWNAKQFTREMEEAYEQMWQRYADQK